MSNCGTCKYFHKDKTDKLLAEMDHDVGVCRWRPAAQNMPISWFSGAGPVLKTGHTPYMRASDGHNCPVFRQRDKKNQETKALTEIAAPLEEASKTETTRSRH